VEYQEGGRGRMNPNNHGTLEACQRLLDNGIVLETEFHWIHNKLKDTWKIGVKTLDMENHPEFWEPIPAPSMAEVWRELPGDTSINKMGGRNYTLLQNHKTPQFGSTNPTDALIDLLIWVRKEGEG
jgi:hypothetical protein